MSKVKSKASKGQKCQSEFLLDPKIDKGLQEAWRQVQCLDTLSTLAGGAGIKSTYLSYVARSLAFCVVHGTPKVSTRAMGQVLGQTLAGAAVLGEKSDDAERVDFIEAVANATYLGGEERTLKAEFAELTAGFEAGLTRPRTDLADAIERAVAKKAEEDAEARSLRDVHAASVLSANPDEQSAAGKGDKNDEKEPQPKTIDLAQKFGEYFHTPAGRPFAAIPVVEDGRTVGRAVCAIGGEPFKRWLGFLHYQLTGDGLSGQRLEGLVGALTAYATFKGAERQVFHRVAKHDGAYWIDMGDKRGRAFKVTAEGWEIVKAAPILFVRPADAKPFVEPLPPGEGNVDDLWQIANIPETERDGVLAVILDSLRPETAYPVLFLNAEAGVGKSTTQRVLRSLVDPNVNPLRSVRKAEDLRAMAASEHLLSLENVSSLPSDLQDMLCSLATGDGGGSQRKLYSDGELHTVNVKRPVIINGIPHSITRTDLMSRTIVVHAEQPTHRKTEEELRALEAELMPSVLGGLLDLFAATLKMLPSVELSQEERSHRLIDYVRLGEALSRVRGRKSGAFVRAYAVRRREEALGTLDENALGSALTRYLEQHGGHFSGTVGELFKKLRPLGMSDTSFPATPKGLRDALSRLKPELRRGGVAIDFGKKVRGARRVTLSLTKAWPGDDHEANDRLETYGAHAQSDSARGVGAVIWGSKARGAKVKRTPPRYTM